LYLDSYFIYLGGTVSDSGGKQITAGRLPVNRTLVLDGNLKYIVRAGTLILAGATWWAPCLLDQTALCQSFLLNC
jgi:hypothetical protein